MYPHKYLILTNSLLEDISYATDNHNYEMVWYLDLEDEKVVPMFDEAYVDIEDDLSDLIESDIEGQRFITIPERYSSDKWENMHDFITSLDENEIVKNLLLTSIQGSGAFVRFKDSLFQIGKLEEWYDYAGKINRQSTLDWLLLDEFISEESIEEGLRLYDELIAQRKQIKQNIANMKKGVVVLCQTNIGHTERLTIGKTYKVLDERPEQLLIRIQNDQGNIKWFPKSHFELE